MVTPPPVAVWPLSGGIYANESRKHGAQGLMYTTDDGFLSLRDALGRLTDLWGRDKAHWGLSGMF